jgi:CHAD domain-containing protein
MLAGADETCMAYRFKLHQPFAKDFRRIGLAQIERAGRELARGAERVTAVHETRKALKRIRALLRLMRPALGGEVFRRENARFRDIAGKLAGEREFDVLVETIVKLEASTQAEPRRRALAALKHEVAAARARAPHPGGETTKEALTLLAQAKKDFARLELRGEGFALIGKGLARGYRAGRKAFEAAYEEPSDEAFHELRKAVQLHWRHMSLIARAWPEQLEVRVAAARRLSQMLGDDHDLAVLVGFAESLAPDRLAPSDVAETVRLARRRQRELRSAARPLLVQLYAERPRAFVARLAVYWEAAQSASREEKDAAASEDSAPPSRRRSAAP